MGSPFLFFTVLSWLLNLLMLAIFVRVLLSWINQDYSNPLVRLVWGYAAGRADRIAGPRPHLPSERKLRP